MWKHSFITTSVSQQRLYNVHVVHFPTSFYGLVSDVLSNTFCHFHCIYFPLGLWLIGSITPFQLLVSCLACLHAQWSVPCFIDCSRFIGTWHDTLAMYIYLSIYLYSSNNKTICNTTIHAIGQDSETKILNTALKMTLTQHKHKSVYRKSEGLLCYWH